MMVRRFQPTAFLLDLDGTLVDGVYAHVLAWHEALNAEGKRLAIFAALAYLGERDYDGLKIGAKGRSPSPYAE